MSIINCFYKFKELVEVHLFFSLKFEKVFFFRKASQLFFVYLRLLALFQLPVGYVLFVLAVVKYNLYSFYLVLFAIRKKWISFFIIEWFSHSFLAVPQELHALQSISKHELETN